MNRQCSDTYGNKYNWSALLTCCSIVFLRCFCNSYTLPTNASCSSSSERPNISCRLICASSAICLLDERVRVISSAHASTAPPLLPLLPPGLVAPRCASLRRCAAAISSALGIGGASSNTGVCVVYPGVQFNGEDSGEIATEPMGVVRSCEKEERRPKEGGSCEEKDERRGDGGST